MVSRIPHHIIIIKNRALGDSLFGLSSIQYLRETYPQAKLTYAIPKWIVPLYQNLETPVDQFFALELKSVSGLFKFLLFVLKNSGVYVELHESPRTHRIAKWVCRLFGKRYFSHNHHFSHRIKTGVHDQGVRKAISQRDLDGVFSALRSLSGSVDYPDFLSFQPLLTLKNVEIRSSKNAIALGVVATRREKCWPIESYVELIDILLQINPLFQFHIPLSTSNEDMKKKNQLLKRIGHLQNVQIHQVPLSQLPRIIQQCQFYIGNDTGLKHLSCLMGLKTCTLFGPEEPLEWHPYDKNRHIFFWNYGPDVRTQMNDVCLLKQFDNSKPIEIIKASEVAKYFEQMLLTKS